MMNSPKNVNRFMLLILFCIIVLSQFLILGIAFLYPAIAKIENIWIVQILSSLLYFALPLVIYRYCSKTTFRELIPFNKISKINIVLAILLGITIQPLLQFVASITDVFQENEISQSIYLFSKLEYWQALLAVAIVPAITEELVFRGIVLTGYKRNTLLTGILMSSIYFGIMHLTITQLFYTIVGGIIFAYVVKITGTIWSGIIAHFVLNGTQIAIAYFLNNSSIQQTESPNSIIVVVSSFFMFLITAPFLILNIYFLKRVNRENIVKYKEQDLKIKQKELIPPKIFTITFFINIILYFLYIAVLKVYL